MGFRKNITKSIVGIDQPFFRYMRGIPLFIARNTSGFTRYIVRNTSTNMSVVTSRIPKTNSRYSCEISKIIDRNNTKIPEKYS